MGFIILLVEDDIHLSECWKIALERAFRDATVIPTLSGKEAYSIYVEKHPRVLVMDVMLPEQNGWETCEKIRQYEEINEINPPAIILMVSGIGPHLNEMTSPRYGADDYMDKPVQIENLTRRIRQLLFQNKR